MLSPKHGAWPKEGQRIAPLALELPTIPEALGSGYLGWSPIRYQA
jgi:hypothetical protein